MRLFRKKETVTERSILNNMPDALMKLIFLTVSHCGSVGRLGSDYESVSLSFGGYKHKGCIINYKLIMYGKVEVEETKRYRIGMSSCADTREDKRRLNKC